ncbi:MAG: osmotically-inducible protein OsmY [Verrucomicrobiales bacterium]
MQTTRDAICNPPPGGTRTGALMEPETQGGTNSALQFSMMKTLRSTYLISAFTLFLPAIPASADEPGDEQISHAVDARLFHDPLVDANDIDVTSSEGVIELRGRVQNLPQKMRAANLAETRRGVRSVVNLLKVIPEPRDDDAIHRDVERALRDRPASETYEISAGVEDGVVTLSGEFTSWAMKALAADIASGVLGVREVVDEIDVDYAGERDDEEIRKHIELRLTRNVWTRTPAAAVEVKNGAVVLSGSAGSAAQRTVMRRLALVDGVESIDDSRVVVSPFSKDSAGRPGFVSLSDEEILEAIEDALILDPRILSINLEVDVLNGTVTLYGSVITLSGRRAADEAAHNTAGVHLVSNLLKVRPTTRPSDDHLAEHVQLALASDAIVSSFRNSVRTRGGRVWLMGEVDSRHESLRADNVAASIPGVTEVFNLLEIADEVASAPRSSRTVPRRGRAKSGDDLLKSVETELYWSWNVDRDAVTVEVDQGTVILTGEVGSRAEFRAAELQAREAGAGWVENRLTVVPTSRETGE